MSELFKPLTLRELTLRNRLAVSPMCQYSSNDGFADDWHLVHLGSRAVGGAGLVITEATAVSPEGRISPADLGLWKDEQIEGLKRMTDFIRQQGAASGIQLAHAGRKASTREPWKGRGQISPAEGGWEPVAPSALAYSRHDTAPLELDLQGIEKVKADFESAAKRSLTAGFDVLEIHAAHGYLLHAFLSPLSNQRQDNYGGALANRARLLLEITRNLRQLWPQDKPIFVRISASDWVEGGWTLEESIILSGWLKAEGVDLIDCSSGGLAPQQQIPVEPLYQVPFAEQIRQQAEIPTGAVGLITTPEEAESILAEGKADLILLAREFLRNPYFPLQAATALNDETSWPIQYERAK